jgi:hypothetical protein
MTTRKPSRKAIVARIMRGVDYAVRVLKRNPERYRFFERRIPRRSECGCLIGLIGQGARLGAHEDISVVSEYAGVHNDIFFAGFLYGQMWQLSRSGRWRYDAALAARHLKEAVRNTLDRAGLYGR